MKHMLVRLSEDLYRIRGAFGSNIYVITENGLTLVDAGFPMDLPVIHLGLRELGAAPRDIDLVIATHYHGDHTGTVAGMKRRHGLCAAMHAADGPYAAGDNPQDTTEVGFFKLLFYTALWPLFRYRYFQVDDKFPGHRVPYSHQINFYKERNGFHLHLSIKSFHRENNLIHHKILDFVE